MDGVFTCNIMGVFQKYKLSYNWLEKDKFKPFEGFFIFLFFKNVYDLNILWLTQNSLAQPPLPPPPPWCCWSPITIADH